MVVNTWWLLLYSKEVLKSWNYYMALYHSLKSSHEKLELGILEIEFIFLLNIFSEKFWKPEPLKWRESTFSSASQINSLSHQMKQDLVKGGRQHAIERLRFTVVRRLIMCKRTASLCKNLREDGTSPQPGLGSFFQWLVFLSWNVKFCSS